MLLCFNILLLLAISFVLSRTVTANESQLLKNWDFYDGEGWTYGNEILNRHIESSILEFTSAGSDPILYGPQYDPLPASNRQTLEIKLKANTAGTWELFYANTSEGRFGGYDQKWSTRFYVPASDDWQIIRVRPFWKAIGNTIKIRLDPACGYYKIDWIRIIETVDSDSSVSWKSLNWLPDQNVKSLSSDKNVLKVVSSDAGCCFLTFVDIDSAKQPTLYFRAKGENLNNLNFCWGNDLSPGLHLAGMAINSDNYTYAANIDLSRFKEWRGRIDTIGFVFENGSLTLEDFSISDSPQGEPWLELERFVSEPVIRRRGQDVSLLAYIRNTGGKTFPGGDISLKTDRIAIPEKMVQKIPALKFNERAIVKWQVRFLEDKSSEQIVRSVITANGQEFSGVIRIEPAISLPKMDYVPEPRPVDTLPYEIGVYYFPGWSPDQWNRWIKQKGFPERDPVLGFYREGDPEVADWHIKWAVENGISFFMYDWYWCDGNIVLEKGLEDGYLKAKYRDYLKFCVMWANHAPFDNHTIEQLLTVTDYWIEKYFRLNCYYKIDGKPVVSFFAPDNLTNDLKGSENVRLAFDAMRKRSQDAGFPGIYFIACGDNSPHSQKRFKAEGYDSISAYNYPTAGATSQWSSYKSLMQGHVTIWNNSLNERILNYIPLLTCGWDSRPWHVNDALVRFGRSTEYFKEGLLALKKWMDHNGRNICLIEAWNEWGEGSYIEPNSEFGFGDLEAIRSVFAQPGSYPQNVAPSDVGLCPYHISIP